MNRLSPFWRTVVIVLSALTPFVAALRPLLVELRLWLF